MKLIKKSSYLLLLFSLLLISSCNHKQDTKIDKLIIDFYKNYEQNNIDLAIDDLYKTNKWFNLSDSSLVNLKTQLKNTVSILGKYNGYELITAKKLGTEYILYSVLTKYERQPLRFTFILYTTNGITSLQNFKFDAEFDDELERAAEVYFLKENY